MLNHARFVNELLIDFINSIHFCDNKLVININIDDKDILTEAWKFEQKIKIIMIDISCKYLLTKYKSSHPEVFLGKGALKICSKFTGEHPCRCAISIKLLWTAASENNNVTYYMLYEFS